MTQPGEGQLDSIHGNKQVPPSSTACGDTNVAAQNTAGEGRGNQSEKFPKGGASLVVQRLRLCTFTLGGLGSTLGWGTKIPHAVWHGQKVKKKKKG